MGSLPRYYGMKLGKLVKAITVDDIHDWRGLQTATGFTEKELNYHLRLLYSDNVLERRNREYFISAKLEQEYQSYYNPKNPEIKPTLSKTELDKPELVSSNKIPRSIQFSKIVLVVACIALLVIGAINILNDPTSTPTESNNSQETNLNPDSSTSENSPSSEVQGVYTDSSPSSVYTYSLSKIDQTAKVVYVQDGDTFQLDNGQWVRLADINTPEEGQTGYQSAKDELTERILGKTVYLDVDSQTDDYGRLVCVVYTLSGTSYKNINYAMVINDYAVYSPHDNDFDYTEWSLYESSDTSGTDALDVPSWAVYVGNKDSKKYHKLSCSYGQKISASNRIYFSSASQAESQGYEPCGICLPSSSDPPSTARYVGNIATKKYHTLSCTYGQKISEGNRRYFSSKTEAENAGYTPCQVCLKTSSSSSSSSTGAVIGNKSSMVYHRPSCKYVAMMSESNKVYFSSESEAVRAGYHPCSYCKP